MPSIKKAKTICVTSTKGGVGKTVITLNLAATYQLLGKKVLILDLDLYGGGIALSLNLKNNKTVYNVVDDMMNNRFTHITDYITTYNDNIDVICGPKDPRQALKIDAKYIDLLLYNVENRYDIVLVDTTHILTEVNLTIMDRCYNNLFVITNDPIDLKNTKSIISIFNDNEINNYKILYNNSRDTGKEYFSMFDIKTVIKANIDYTISQNFYIKEIDNYTLEGKILLLDKKIQRTKRKDFNNYRNMALDLIKEEDKKVKRDEEENTN